MRLNRIMAVAVPHCVQYTKIAVWLEILFFWIFGVLIFGFLSKSIIAVTANPMMGFLIVFGAVAARPSIIQAPVQTAACIISEAVNRTLVSTLATPITFLEWTCATAIIGFVGMILYWVLGSLLTFIFFDLTSLFFHIDIALFVSKILLLCIPLLFSTFTLSLYLSALAYIMGRKGAQLLWMLIWSFGSICGTYYPVATLPLTFQKIAWFLPMTYIFEGLRAQMMTGASIWPNLAISIAMSIGYAIPALLLLYAAFKRAKKHGLAHLESA